MTGDRGDRIGGTCPTCGSATAEQYRPFCSRRCADVDLGRWFSGRYRLPDTEAGTENEAPPEENE